MSNSPGYKKDDDGKVTLDCPRCGGTGSIVGALVEGSSRAITHDCPDCLGTGKKSQVKKHRPRWTTDEERGALAKPQGSRTDGSPRPTEEGIWRHSRKKLLQKYFDKYKPYEGEAEQTLDELEKIDQAREQKVREEALDELEEKTAEFIRGAADNGYPIDDEIPTKARAALTGKDTK